MPSLGAEPCAALCDVVTEGRRPLRIGVDVAVLPNDKGQGLYALRDIEAGTLLERYRGILMEEDENQASSSTGHYAMGLANGKIVDGEWAWRSNFVRCVGVVTVRSLSLIHI